ncbi:MAG: hypothetical protein FJ087_03920 [Deltaproteobacteria bacterium]|nr:hypothetical protein [Deltaproteobacteria bacterium]
MRWLSAAKQEWLRLLTHGLVLPPLPAEPDRGACPQCSGPMVVQKSTPRQGRTLEHGRFDARETVLVCAARCRTPSGSLVTRRAACLSERLLPRSAVGYDVLVFVGMQRFAEHRQREEIKSALWNRFGLDLSTGEVSRLAVIFTEYLRRLHEAHGPALRAALERDGGWPMHIDATGEDGRGTLLVVMAGWRHWVLGAWRIPTERADAILPHLRDTVLRFGPPCAVMRDLGRAMRTAAQPAGRPQVIRTLDRLCAILEPVAREKAFADLDRLLTYRVALFEELRTALRLVPKPAGRRDTPVGGSGGTTPAEMEGIKSAVDRLALSLHKRRPRRGPAQDARQAIDLVLRHLEDHGAYLWDRAVQLPQKAGGGLRLVDRTNNLPEAFFHGIKHGERRRSGRKGLAADFESRPASAALVPNLKRPDYVAIVCGTLDNLPQAFAKLYAGERGRLPAPADRHRGTATIRASASKPREDRMLVRSDAMSRAIMSAARSRAPRTTPRHRHPSVAAFCQA